MLTTSEQIKASFDAGHRAGARDERARIAAALAHAADEYRRQASRRDDPWQRAEADGIVRALDIVRGFKHDDDGGKCCNLG